MAAELVVPHQRTERIASESTVLFFVDLLEDLALVEFDCLIQVLEQIRLADVHELDLKAARSLGLLYEIVQTAPSTLQLLQGLGVDDFVELPGNQGVEVGDATVDHEFLVL